MTYLLARMTTAAIDAEIARLLRAGVTVSDVILHGQRTKAWRLENVAAVIKKRGWSVREDDDRISTSPPQPPPYVPPARTDGRRRRTPPTKVRCGTMAGYRRHKRRREPRCDACLDAYAEDRQAYRERQRRSQAEMRQSADTHTSPAGLLEEGEAA